jgi:hypothetical protein
MKLTTAAFVEHQTSGAQLSDLAAAGDLALMAPGACTTCFGSTCCSCSCSGVAAS